MRMQEQHAQNNGIVSMLPMQAPFPWYGGKSRAAQLIWTVIGNVRNYVEPFAGSLAVLLQRPTTPHIETVNDKDALLCNVWRALKTDPTTVASWCDRPVNEAEQHSIHCWLLAQLEEMTARLMGDPDYYDAKIAGRWLYGICCWIGSEWCSGHGAWQSIDGKLVHLGNAGQGIHRKRVHLGDAGQGIHRKRVHLGNAGRGIHRQLVHLGDAGQGIHRQRVHLGNAGQGDEGLLTWFEALQGRLRYVRVCCGDWSRVCGPSVTFKHGLTGMLFDPPYSAEEDREADLYREDDDKVAYEVRAWCLANGKHPLLRIVLCGYGNIHDALLTHGWQKYSWMPNGGYGN